MGVVLSTAPPAFGFSKDLLSAFFTCDDYALKTNYAIHFKLFLEKADYSGYDEIYDTRLYLLPGSSGQVEAVIADKLHDAISADIAKLHPDIPDQGQALVCQKSCRKYYFQYREVHDGSDGPLVLFNTSPTYTILHGGLSFRAQFSTTLANLLQPAAPAQDRFLKQGNVNCYTRTNQPQYLYFFNGRDFSGSTELRVKYFYDDNTEGTGVLHSFSMQAFRKYAFHVGYSSLSPASNKRLVKYEVWLQQGSNKRSETRTYLMNYQIRDYVRYFLNWSSWGGLDTRLCYGQGNAEFELFQKEAKKQLKQGFDIKSGQYTVYDVYGQSQFTVATGWMSREDLIHFRDFYLSSIKYRYVGGLLMPIQVTSRNITELSDGNHLHAQEFQYRYLYDDHAYTEGDIEEPGQGFGDFFFSSGPVDNPTGGYTETDPTVPYWVKQITLDDIVKWNAGASFNPSDYLTQTTADGRYVTQATEQLSLPGNKGWTGRHHFSGALSLPQSAPVAPVSGETYIWFGNPGGGTTPPPAYGNLEDLQNVADVIDDGKYIQKVGGEWKGVDITFPDLSSYAQIGTGAGQVRNNTQLDARYAAISHTHTIAQVTGLQSQLDGFAVRAADNNFTARNHFSGALSIPQVAPASPVAGQAYVWFGEPGTGSGGGVEISNLEDLQNVADVIADGKYLRKVSGEWQGVDITFPDLSSYAPKAWVTAGFAPIAHTHSISQITGLQTQLDGKAAISHTHNASDINAGTLGIARIPTGTTSSTVAIGNDSRIVNGQTAYGWGNHGLAGYAVRAANNNFTARNHFSGALSIPQAAPASPVAGQSYIWFGAPGSGGGGGTSGTFAGLDDVAFASLANNQLIRYNSSTGKWVNFTANYAAASHTHPISQITGLQSALDGKEPAFSKNTGFNRPFGTTANTVAQGNDSRIVNGQTAFNWGDFRDFGLGVEAPSNISQVSAWDNIEHVSFIRASSAGNSPFPQAGVAINIPHSSGGARFQLFAGVSQDGLYFRRRSVAGSWGSIRELWHSGNLANGTTSQYIRGDGSLATFPTIGSGTLSLSTGTGLSGSASFGANQTGNTTFSVSVASGYTLPTNGQVSNWNAAFGWGDFRDFGLGVETPANISPIASWDDIEHVSFIRASSAGNTPFPQAGVAINIPHSSGGARFQLFGGVSSSGLYFRRRSNVGTWTAPLEVWHNGNIDPVPTSRQINTGDHLTGGGNLSQNRSLSVVFSQGNYVLDSGGNPRLYFGSAATNDVVLRLGHTSGIFRFRNSANANIVSIESSGKITCPVIEPSAIIVPSAAPSSPESGKRYIWFS